MRRYQPELITPLENVYKGFSEFPQPRLCALALYPASGRKSCLERKPRTELIAVSLRSLACLTSNKRLLSPGSTPAPSKAFFAGLEIARQNVTSPRRHMATTAYGGDGPWRGIKRSRVKGECKRVSPGWQLVGCHSIGWTVVT